VLGEHSAGETLEAPVCGGQSRETALTSREPWAGNANLPPMVDHWLTIHAEPGRLGWLVSSGVM
jgi:hypothetical protein